MKPFAITLDAGTSLSNHTGSWRTKKPVYAKHLPPCNQACPAGENIQAWLSFAETGDYENAWREIVKNNPMPACMGRVCYHPCESACNRKSMDSSVNINAVERFIGDEALSKGWKFGKPVSPSGKKILVIGSGPAGLSAAYHLALLGHKVAISESAPKAGGMMRYGIPKYRLPRKVLDGEIQRILDLGVDLRLNAKIDDVAKAMKDGKYDAVFVAVGAHIAKLTDIPTSGKGAARILDAVAVLRAMEGKEKIKFGKQVLVYGGGNTAIDVARTAVRLGSKVTIIYRRTREKMPAHNFEIEEALQEGIELKCLVTIKKAVGTKVTLEKMTLDKEGKAKATGKYETIKADSIVLALGQDTDLSSVENVAGLETENGLITVNAAMATTHEGIFAGGDAVPSPRTVTTGIGHGKKAARSIDAWLRGKDLPTTKNKLATAERLNDWYYDKVERAERALIDVSKRRSTFDEVQKGLSKDEALAEAQRCLSCGNCFECDNCYSLCPDNAIKKLGAGKGFAVNYDYCKGCGICATECPCGAIDMKAEDI